MKKYLFHFLAFVCISFVFSNYTFSQTRKRPTAKRAGSTVKSSKSSSSSSRNNTSKQKPQAKRAATLSSSSAKRAATSSGATSSSGTSSGGTAKRAATTNSSAKRAATNVSSKRAATGGRTSPTVTKNNTTTSNTSKITTCPIGVVIKKTTDDKENEVFYSAKDTVCNKPENVTGQQGLNGLDLPTWMAGKNAYIFSCNSGFIKTNENDVDICVNQNTICPLNTTISKKNNKYINPSSNKECYLPAFASTLKLNEETNKNTAIPVNEAYYTYCNKNYYKNSNIECKPCPSGKYNNGAYIKYENGTDNEKKGQLVEGATGENQCYTMEELTKM